MEGHHGSILAVLTLLLLLRSMRTQVNECLTKETCSECISHAAELCVWCEDSDLIETETQRCNVSSNHSNNWCDNTVSPRTEILTQIQGDDNIQVQPTFLDLKMRPGDPVNLTVTVTRLPNYPIDLYYLMDLSKSMNDDLLKLKSLAKDLSTLLTNITSDYQLGFGKFVDKVTLPYTDTYEPRLNNPCMDINNKSSSCPRSYSFVNSQPLTADSAVFEQAIQREETSSNVDSPEGQFDALMQVIVCTDVIGWRKNAWHLVVLATDEQYHVAGDGRLAGIYAPNTGKCRTTKGPNGMYVGGLDEDYPSVSQIREHLRDAQIIPLFTVTNRFQLLYDRLQEGLLPVTSFVGELQSDSTNVVNLIREGYEEVASVVTLDVPTDLVDASISVAQCGSSGTVTGATCAGVKIGQKAVFNVELKLKACADKKFSLLLAAIPFGVTTVNVTSVCECDCTLPDVKNSSVCNYHGSLSCGACECFDGWSGYVCDNKCIPGEQTVTSGCSPDDTTLPCYGRGQCDCNKCYCNTNDAGEALWVGQYCECPSLRCDDGINGQQCGGPSQGECKCKPISKNECECRCDCKSGWDHSPGLFDCDCKTNKSSCVTAESDNTTELCSGHGDCVCDTCDCWPAFIDGDKCALCSTCESVCTITEECVKQKLFETGNETCDYIFEQHDDDEFPASYVVENGTDRFTDSSVPCQFKDNDSCDHFYYVGFDPRNRVFDNADSKEKFFGHLVIHYLSFGSRKCPGEVKIVPIVLGIIGGIVLIGLLLLLVWWLLHKLALHREYLAFKREMASANWNQTTSPLYEPPTKKYKNPAYKKKTMT